MFQHTVQLGKRCSSVLIQIGEKSKRKPKQNEKQNKTKRCLAEVEKKNKQEQTS